MTASALDGVPGLGPVRKARLLKEVGGVRALRAASEDDLRALAWLPDRVAGAVHSRLHAATAGGGHAATAGAGPVATNGVHSPGDPAAHAVIAAPNGAAGENVEE